MFSSQHLPRAVVGSLSIVAGSLGCSGPSEVAGAGAGAGPFSALTEAEFACIGPTVGESSGTPPTFLGKFGAEFKGVSFGDGTSPANTLRKKVPVTFAQSTPDFSLGDAWVFRSSAQFENCVYYTIGLTYLGDEPRCHVKLDPLRFMDANGQVLVADPTFLQNVSGSAGGLDCIAKGETAEAVSLATGSVIPTYSQIASIEVGGVTGLHGASSVVKASVAATDLCKTKIGFVVSLLNRGAQAARVSDIHRYLLSDGEGPVEFGILRRLLPLSQSTSIKPNERSILSEGYFFSHGRADRAIIFTDYNDDGG